VTTIQGDAVDRIDTTTNRLTNVFRVTGGPAPFALSASGRSALVGYRFRRARGSQSAERLANVETSAAWWICVPGYG
jgi:hypothetical protein